MEQTFDFDVETLEEEASFEIGETSVPEADVLIDNTTPEVEGGPLFGASTHPELGGRSLPDQHPISAITGLDDALSQKQPKGDYALKSELPVVPKKVSAFENDAGYLTEHQDISGLATKEELSGKQDTISDLEVIRSNANKGASAVQPSTLNDYASKQALIDGLSTKQDIIPDLEIIRMGANKGETAVQPNALKSYVPTSRKINNKELTTDIVLSAGDVSALPDSTNYGATLSASIDNVNYILTLTLKDQKGNVLGTPATVDLPLESVVVSGSYNNETKEVVLSLQNGSEIKFSVADLVSGLQPTIPDLSEIRDGASKGETAVQPNQLSAVATSGSYNDLANKPTIPTKTSQLTNNSDFTTKEYVDQQVGNIETALNNINSGG